MNGERQMHRFTSDAEATEVVRALREDGVAVVEHLLDDAQVDELKSTLAALLDTVDVGTNAFLGRRTKRVFALLSKTRAADAIAVHPLVLAVLDEVLEHYQLSAPVVVQIHPGEVAQTLHRDATSYPLRQHDGGELVLNVMWAVDEFTELNGATRMIPGSHRWPDQSAATEEATVTATMPRGSICLFLGSLVHGGGANRDERPRVGLIMEYAAAWLRPQENLALAIDRDTARRMPRRLAELIGYDLYPPFLGYVDGRHPGELLDAAPRA